MITDDDINIYLQARALDKSSFLPPNIGIQYIKKNILKDHDYSITHKESDNRYLLRCNICNGSLFWGYVFLSYNHSKQLTCAEEIIKNIIK